MRKKRKEVLVGWSRVEMKKETRSENKRFRLVVNEADEDSTFIVIRF